MPDRKSPGDGMTAVLRLGTLLYVLLLFSVWLVSAADVYFSPKGGCTAAVVAELLAAKREVRVLAYAFTSDAIGDALIAARKRGVDVKAAIDKRASDTPSCQATRCRHAGIAVHLDGHHSIMHDKVIVIDGETVITGSFNFSKQAETANAENLVVIRDKQLAAKFLKNWQRHFDYADKPQEPAPPR